MRLALACLILLVTSVAHAAVPQKMPVQGILRDNAGVPVAGGTFSVTFALYSAETGGAPVWQEAWPPAGESCATHPEHCVSVADGVFHVELGALEPFGPGLFASPLWLGITVETDPELPRRSLGSTAYALEAAHAGVASGLDCSDCVPATALSIDVPAADGPGGAAVHALTADEAGGLSCTNCVGLAHLTPEVVAALQAGGTVTAEGLPADGLDEVSNGTLTNTFDATLASTDTPLTNNPLKGTIVSTIAVPFTGAIQDVSVSIALQHADVGEVSVSVTAPGGATLLLYDHGAPGQTGLTTTWTTKSTLPTGSLASFVGAEVHGDWTLTVTDLTVGNEGTLTGWSLELVTLSGVSVQVNGDLAVTGTLTVGGVAVDPGPRTYVVPGATAPPGAQVLERYYTGAGTGQYCKKRVRSTCSCGCGTSLPGWATSDPDCTTGTCITNCEGVKECTPDTFPDGWTVAPPAGDFYVPAGGPAGCNCGPFWYRYERTSAQASWTRARDPN